MKKVVMRNVETKELSIWDADRVPQYEALCEDVKESPKHTPVVYFDDESTEVSYQKSLPALPSVQGVEEAADNYVEEIYSNYVGKGKPEVEILVSQKKIDCHRDFVAGAEWGLSQVDVSGLASEISSLRWVLNKIQESPRKTLRSLHWTFDKENVTVVQHLESLWQRLNSQSNSPVKGEDQEVKSDLGVCKRCNREPATTDYNGHGYYVCDHCNNHLNDEFDEEYK